MQETQEKRVRSLGWEDPLEKRMATHSSTLAWKIPWTEEPGRLQSLGLQRIQNWAHTFTLTRIEEQREKGRVYIKLYHIIPAQPSNMDWLMDRRHSSLHQLYKLLLFLWGQANEKGERKSGKLYIKISQKEKFLCRGRNVRTVRKLGENCFPHSVDIIILLWDEKIEVQRG